jgi:flagellar assembly factor FliW
MKIVTLRFGELEIPEDKIIELPKGLLGFEQFHKYVILQREDSEPFSWLQSLEDPNLAFVITNPAFFFPNYRIEMHMKELDDIQVDETSNVETYVVVTIPKDITQMSANLQGPIVINTDIGMAKQVVLVNGPYTIQHFILDELERRAGKRKKERQSMAVRI